MPRIRKVPLTVFEQNLGQLSTPKAGFRAIYGGLALVAYNMQGAQQATTTVATAAGPQVFTTTDNMHSEMVALQYMLQSNQWIVQNGAVRIPQPHAAAPIPVPPANFVTTQPHCGYCTIALSLLNLPLTAPTRGNYNLAANYNYPLAEPLVVDPNVLAWYWDRASIIAGTPAGVVVKRILNAMMNQDAASWVLSITTANGIGYFADAGQVAGPGGNAVFDWSLVPQGGYLGMIWSRIWECLYQVNNE